MDWHSIYEAWGWGHRGSIIDLLPDFICPCTHTRDMLLLLFTFDDHRAAAAKTEAIVYNLEGSKDELDGANARLHVEG